MKRIQARVSSPLALAIAVGLIIGLVSIASAEGHHKPNSAKPCSNKTLKGTYGYYRAGTNLDDGGPVVAVGIITYDGMENTFLTDSVNRNGEIELDQEFSGRYQVNPDCSGMLFLEDGEEWARIVIVKGGKSVYVLSEHNPYYAVATRIDGD